ncbi:MAG: GGDEF domain-containing protein [Magnetococcales bacterium]|nr:GGDEF domain-containing protein [Magnetococcales bacterium]
MTAPLDNSSPEVSPESGSPDQPGLDEAGLASRLRLFGMTDEDAATLGECSNYFAARAPVVVAEFFDILMTRPEAQEHIGKVDTLQMLRRSLQAYIVDLFQGRVDLAYVASRLRIGRIHQRIGVPPGVYLAAMNILHELLQEEMFRLGGESCATELRQRRQKALTTLLMFDTALVFETYSPHSQTPLTEPASELEELSRKDALTGLFNQVAFLEYLRQQMALALRYHDVLTLVCFRLNDFQTLSSQAGREGTDQVLALLGKCLVETLRTEDIPFRTGEGAFAIIMPKTLETQATEVFRRLIRKFKGRTPHPATFSIGIAQTGPQTFLTQEQLLETAERCLQTASGYAERAPGFYIHKSGLQSTLPTVSFPL